MKTGRRLAAAVLGLMFLPGSLTGQEVDGGADLADVESIDGLRSNVIGLPVEVVLPLLSRFGVDTP